VLLSRRRIANRPSPIYPSKHLNGAAIERPASSCAPTLRDRAISGLHHSARRSCRCESLFASCHGDILRGLIQSKRRGTRKRPLGIGGKIERRDLRCGIGCEAQR
jgi:hypothetical protein